MFRRLHFLVLVFGVLAASSFNDVKAANPEKGSPIRVTMAEGASGQAGIQFTGGYEDEGPPDSGVAPLVADNCEACNGCGNQRCPRCGQYHGGYAGDPPWSVWVWGAPTYASGAIESVFGFAEGINAGYRIADGLGLYCGVGFDHTGNSTQVLGTVGIQKFGNPGGDGLDRASIWVMWDQFTDTRSGAFYTHQFRFNFGYLTSETTEVGMTYSTPTSGGLGVGMITPMGGTNLLSSGDTYFGPYVRTLVGNTEMTSSIGYATGGETVALGVGARVPTGDSTNFLVDMKYGGQATWGLMAGLEVGLGRADTTRY